MNKFSHRFLLFIQNNDAFNLFMHRKNSYVQGNSPSPEQRSIVAFRIPQSTIMRHCYSWLNCNFRDLFADHRTKKLFTGPVTALFLEATFRQRKSLDEICANLQASPWLQQWVKLDSVSTGALYTKLNELPLDELQDIYYAILDEISKQYRSKRGVPDLGPIYAVDSTEIILPPSRGAWAFTTEKKNFVRMHTCLRIADEDSACPHRIVLTTGAVHEQEILPYLVIDDLATYVFDRGYVNYEHFAEWEATGVHFVARLKRSNRCEILQRHPIRPGSCIRLDAEVRIVQKKKGVCAKLRLVEYDYLDRNGKIIRIRVLTNRWDLTAEQISEIYRNRWRVESFFKWMKQHAHLKKLHNHKENAVWNQIYLSLIAHAVCELIRLTMKPEATCWSILQAILLYGERADTHLEEVVATAKVKRKRSPTKRAGPPEEQPAPVKQRIVVI